MNTPDELIPRIVDAVAEQEAVEKRVLDPPLVDIVGSDALEDLSES